MDKSATSRSAGDSNQSESKILKEILLEFGALPRIRLWRVNTGMAYGLAGVKNAVAMLSKGDIKGALTTLKYLRPVRFGTPGQADIQGVAHGYFVAIETKTESGKQSEEQKRWEDMVHACGGVYIVARNAGDVRKMFVAMGWLNA